MKAALGPEGGRNFRFPNGLEWVEVEPETGLRAGWGCRGRAELFLVGTAPELGCGRRYDQRWQGLRRSIGPDLLDEVERWLRRGDRSRRRPLRIGGSRSGR